MDNAFQPALTLLESGDVDGLRHYLSDHAFLVRERASFPGASYSADASLLQLIAENPVRRGHLPANAVDVATVILEAGAKADQSAMNDTLGLVASGRVARECRVQVPLIDLLCNYGADVESALVVALVHGEFEAVEALLRRGARLSLPAAAGLGRTEEVKKMLLGASSLDRQQALAVAAQFGRVEIVQLLLDAGEDPNRFNPAGFHSHSTPLHQAVAGGHEATVRLMVDRGARLDLEDRMWKGTPLGWATYEGKTAIESYLRTLAAR